MASAAVGERAMGCDRSCHDLVLTGVQRIKTPGISRALCFYLKLLTPALFTSVNMPPQLASHFQSHQAVRAIPAPAFPRSRPDAVAVRCNSKAVSDAGRHCSCNCRAVCG